MQPTLFLYTKAPDNTGLCPFCDQAKAWLQEKGIPFQEISYNPEERQIFYSMLGLVGNGRTVPQAVIVDADGLPQRIGGYNELTHSGIESLFS